MQNLWKEQTGIDKYPIESDTYTLTHRDMEKVKEESKEEHSKTLVQQKSIQEELSTSVSMEEKKDDVLDL